MFILDSNRFARDRAALSGEVEAMITAAGGEVLVSRLWEERRLAYAIGSHRKGTYWLIYFSGPSSMVEPLNRQSELQESILRHLVLKIHPHLVDVMLEHAKAGPAPPAAAPPAATPRDRRVPDMTVDAAADN
jgi:small subunit ribosomal protein S6